MARTRISHKAWRTASDILLYYPDMKKEYKEMVDAAIAPDKPDGNTGDVTHKEMPDPTASAAMRLAGNKRAARLRLEIEAVEYATDDLNPFEYDVIRQRFWYSQSKGRRWPRSYDALFKIPYSERTMHKIVQGVIIKIALYIGEL